MVVYLLSDRAKHVTGQVYTVVGSKIAVWNQPEEVRAMWADGRWTPEQIAERLDDNIGQERMAMIDRLEQMRQAAASGEQPETPDQRRSGGYPVQAGPGLHRAVDLQGVALVVGGDDGGRTRRLVGEHPAHALSPGNR